MWNGGKMMRGFMEDGEDVMFFEYHTRQMMIEAMQMIDRTGLKGKATVCRS